MIGPVSRHGTSKVIVKLSPPLLNIFRVLPTVEFFLRGGRHSCAWLAVSGEPNDLPRTSRRNTQRNGSTCDKLLIAAQSGASGQQVACSQSQVPSRDRNAWNSFIANGKPITRRQVQSGIWTISGSGCRGNLQIGVPSLPKCHDNRAAAHAPELPQATMHSLRRWQRGQLHVHRDKPNFRWHESSWWGPVLVVSARPDEEVPDKKRGCHTAASWPRDRARRSVAGSRRAEHRHRSCSESIRLWFAALHFSPSSSHGSSARFSVGVLLHIPLPWNRFASMVRSLRGYSCRVRTWPRFPHQAWASSHCSWSAKRLKNRNQPAPGQEGEGTRRDALQSPDVCARLLCSQIAPSRPEKVHKPSAHAHSTEFVEFSARGSIWAS